MGGTAERGTGGLWKLQGLISGLCLFQKNSSSCMPMICTLFWIILYALFSRAFFSFASIMLIEFPKQVRRSGRECLIFFVSSQGLPGPAQGRVLEKVHLPAKGTGPLGTDQEELGGGAKEPPFSLGASSRRVRGEPVNPSHVNSLLSGGIAQRSEAPRKPPEGYFMCLSHQLLQGP